MGHSKQGTHWLMHTTLHCESRKRIHGCVCDDGWYMGRKVNQWRALRVATMASNACVDGKKEARVKKGQERKK